MPTRTCWLALSLVLLPFALAAQEAPTRLVGLVVGMNRSTMGGEGGTSAGYTEKSGMVLGLQAQRKERSGQAFLRASILYSERGGRQDGGSGSELRLNMRYVEVPVLLGFSLFSESRFTPQVLAGLQAGARASCRFVFISPGAPTQDEKCKDFGFETSSLDFALVSGAGFSLETKRGIATFSALYNQGVKTIDGEAPVSKIFNRGWGFSVGFLRTRWR